MSLRLPREQEQDPEIVSPLLKLPAELRCIIYSYALGVPKWNRRHDFDCSYPEDALPPFRTLPERHDSRIPLRELESKDMHECSKNLGLPLLRTCKQIHNEALEYLWEKGPGFCFGDADSFVRAVRELPKALRTKVKKVRRPFHRSHKVLPTQADHHQRSPSWTSTAATGE